MNVLFVKKVPPFNRATDIRKAHAAAQMYAHRLDSYAGSLAKGDGQYHPGPYSVGVLAQSVAHTLRATSLSDLLFKLEKISPGIADSPIFPHIVISADCASTLNEMDFQDKLDILLRRTAKAAHDLCRTYAKQLPAANRHSNSSIIKVCEIQQKVLRARGIDATVDAAFGKSPVIRVALPESEKDRTEIELLDAGVDVEIVIGHHAKSRMAE